LFGLPGPRNLVLDNIPGRPYVDRVPFTAGRLRRRARGGAGCGVPRARLVTALPGGSGNRPSATTSGREELADGEAFLLHPAPDRSPKSRRGAPRGERPALWDVRRPMASAGHWPPTGAAAPERLSALRSLAVYGEGNSKPRRSVMPRERDHACARQCSMWGIGNLAKRPIAPAHRPPVDSARIAFPIALIWLASKRASGRSSTSARVRQHDRH